MLLFGQDVSAYTVQCMFLCFWASPSNGFFSQLDDCQIPFRYYAEQRKIRLYDELDDEDEDEIVLCQDKLNWIN